MRPCGDPLDVCVYAGPHDGPHKYGGDRRRLKEAIDAYRKQRAEADSAAPGKPEMSVAMSDADEGPA